MRGFIKFSDFFKYVQDNPEKIMCPFCGAPIEIFLTPTFNIDVSGSALCKCLKQDCGFNKMNFRIEACRR